MVFKFAIVMIMSFALCGPALGQRARGSGGIGDRITPGIGSTGSQGIGQGSGVGSLGDTLQSTQITCARICRTRSSPICNHLRQRYRPSPIKPGNSTIAWGTGVWFRSRFLPLHRRPTHPTAATRTTTTSAIESVIRGGRVCAGGRTIATGDVWLTARNDAAGPHRR